MHLNTIYLTLGLTMGFLAMAWTMPLSSNTVDRRALLIVDVTIEPDRNSQARQSLGLSGSSIRVPSERVRIGPNGVNFQVHSGSSLLGTGHLKANAFVVPQSEMHVEFWNNQHLYISEHSTAHFNIRNEEVVVIEGPHSDVDDMTHLLTGFYVNYNETHH
ncbi:MAG: hypothetical protein NXY57DRAFT_1040704 [Lentinula lateritia]|uniref:Uncharacterized protein n=1 Tax=Lentinula lateritia TaxID=40482 RepID=A0ABQ8V6Q8_9AGAR|nr:MAG: hypothetical protein NXY57DRAFT_1040704 [Lentinula lateritia]KAJ4477111.1 hypothetical protein C8R41DRAFT_869599 [Lentinula lateritia]